MFTCCRLGGTADVGTFPGGSAWSHRAEPSPLRRWRGSPWVIVLKALICVDLLQGAGMQMESVASCCRSSRIYRNMQTPPHLKIRIASLPVQVLLPILSLIHLTAHSEDPQQASFHQFSPSEDAGAVSAHSAATLVSDSVATAQKVPGTLVFLKVGCNLRPGGVCPYFLLGSS